MTSDREFSKASAYNFFLVATSIIVTIVVVYYSNVFVRKIYELDCDILEYTDELISSYVLLSTVLIFLGLSFTLASINMRPSLKKRIKSSHKFIIINDPDIYAGTSFDTQIVMSIDVLVFLHVVLYWCRSNLYAELGSIISFSGLFLVFLLDKVIYEKIMKMPKRALMLKRIKISTDDLSYFLYIILTAFTLAFILACLLHIRIHLCNITSFFALMVLINILVPRFILDSKYRQPP